MQAITTITDLYVESIRDVYHGEVLLIPELSFFLRKSSDPQLQNMIKNHLMNTRAHTARLEEIQENLNADLLQEHCRTMKSMILETKDLVNRCTTSELQERAIVQSLHRITQCITTVYQMLISLAEELKIERHQNILQQNLEDERKFDKQISAYGFNSLFNTFNPQNKLS